MNKAEQDALIKAAQSGDRHGFETLIELHYELMFKFAYKWCGNQGDAQDITQDACIKLARALDSYKGNAAFTSWLYRIVINCGKDWYKKQNRHPATPELTETAQVNSGSDETLYAKQVIAAVHELPDGEKDAILLVLSEGLSHKEAANILGCKESTISWRIHEARKKLNAQFNKEPHYG